MSDEEGLTVVEEEEEEEEEEVEEEEEEKVEVKKVEEVDKALLRDQFALFSKFGDKSADGKTIKLSQSDKWFRQVRMNMMRRMKKWTMRMTMMMMMMVMRMVMMRMGPPHEDEDRTPLLVQLRHLVPALGRCQKYCRGLSRLILVIL